MSNIVSLSGKEVHPPGEVETNVVAELEDLLERARSGEINGIAVITHCADDATGNSLTGVVSWSMLGKIEKLKIGIYNSLTKD